MMLLKYPLDKIKKKHIYTHGHIDDDHNANWSAIQNKKKMRKKANFLNSPPDTLCSVCSTFSFLKGQFVFNGFLCLLKGEQQHKKMRRKYKTHNFIDINFPSISDGCSVILETEQSVYRWRTLLLSFRSLFSYFFCRFYLVTFRSCVQINAWNKFTIDTWIFDGMLM